MGLGGELQPAAGGEVEGGSLGDDGGQRRSTEPFLGRPQQVLIGVGVGAEQPVRVEPEAGEAVAVERRFVEPAAAGHP